MNGDDTAAAKFWNEKYESVDVYSYGTEPNDFLKQATVDLNFNEEQITSSPSSSSPPPTCCLMLADGEGRNGVFMAQSEKFDKVVSVDISQIGLDKAMKLAESRGVDKTKIETVLCDLATYDFGVDKWDCIVSIFCHLPPPVRSKVYEQVPKSLKAGGYFILESYTPKQLEYKTGGPPVVEMMVTSDMLHESFANSLHVMRNEELDRDVIEGTLHTGRAAVVQFIGRKK
jgi:hypothetical protein